MYHMKLTKDEITTRLEKIKALPSSEVSNVKLNALAQELKNLSKALYKRRHKNIEGLVEFKRQVRELRNEVQLKLAAQKVVAQVHTLKAQEEVAEEEVIEEVSSPSVEAAQQPNNDAIVVRRPQGSLTVEQNDAARLFVRGLKGQDNAWLTAQALRYHMPWLLMAQVLRYHMPAASVAPLVLDAQSGAIIARPHNFAPTATMVKASSISELEDGTYFGNFFGDDEVEVEENLTPVTNEKTYVESEGSIFDGLRAFDLSGNDQQPVVFAAGENKTNDTTTTENKAEEQTDLPGPNVQDTPVYVALKAEVERLEAKASQACGIEGFIWKSNYQAKAENARTALTAIELEHNDSKAMDDLIAEKIVDTNSDMYKALNTHSSYICQFTASPTSWKARALINIEKAIEDNKPAAENEEAPTVVP